MKTLGILQDAVPEFQSFPLPSVSTISRVVHIARHVNVMQTVAFLENATDLTLAFDDSKKNGQTVTAVVVTDEQCNTICLVAAVSIYNDAEYTALHIQEALGDLSVEAFKAGLLPLNRTPFEWMQAQMQKVKTILTDSCNTARRSADELKSALEDYFEISNDIVLTDCAMHIGNYCFALTKAQFNFRGNFSLEA